MARRKDFRKANSYTGQKIKGPIDVSYKIDGVRMLYREGECVTRNDKVPPGFARAMTGAAVEKLQEFGDCEIFKEEFLKTAPVLNSDEPTPGYFTDENVYPLDFESPTDDHDLDDRLKIGTFSSVTKEWVSEQLLKALGLGYEGLVLRTATHWYRVKPYYTADVRVTGWFEQHDKHGEPKGQLGGFDTNYGKVTAFSDDERVLYWDNPEQYVGQLIEVIYRELYHTGKFRYCVTFNRFRTDKDEESFDTGQWKGFDS